MSRNSLLTRILVPLDGSERANAALALAAQLVSPSSELILAQVVPESRGIRDSIGNWRISAADMTRELTDLAENNLADASAAVARQHPGVAISTAVRIGEPARGILQIANDLDASMIVMASQGRGAFGRAVLGSVADKVFRLSSLPVLIQHDDGADFSGRPIHRIVVPLDGSDLAESAIPPATTVASALGLPLHLLSIVDPTRSSSAALAYAAAFSEQLHQELLEAAEAEARHMLEDLTLSLEGGDDLDCTIETGSGPAARSILEHLRPGDLLVMTSHGRGGFERFLIGSTAEKLIQGGSAPVLLVPSATASGQKTD